MTKQELEIKRKNELDKKNEYTRAEKIFTPDVDIYENDEALMMEVEMPGVHKGAVEVNLDNNLLTLRGRIEPKEYKDYRPLYGEYNIGHYERVFELGQKINQEKIKANMEDGILYLTIPKADKVKPRLIEVH